MSMKIGIIDDSELAVAWAQKCLEQEGYEVVSCTQSFGLQTFVRRNRPSVLLLDINMPAIKGDSVCRLLKSKKETKDTKVLLYSSLSDAELAERVDACGADGYLAKTSDSSSFLHNLRICLLRLGHRRA